MLGNRFNVKQITEALVVGVGLTILAYILQMINKDLWTKNFYMTMFALGVFFHLLAEFSGINKWYCKNGNACII
jgi:hypothetical protein